jgi:two-component system, NarL family, response regulator, fimbrial Z protein, FimZ
MRIILADHHPNVLRALITMLSEETEFQIVGEAVDADSLMTQTAATCPDLVLFDAELPGQPVDDLIASLHTCVPRPVVIAMSSKSEHGRKLLTAGADVFVSKTDQADWLLETLQKFDKYSSK